MCDPLVGTLLSAGISVASGMANQQSQQDLLNAQNKANEEWVAYQNQIRRQAMTDQESLRQKSESSRQDTLTKVAPKAQIDDQTAEAARLNTNFTAGSNKTVTPADITSMAPGVGKGTSAGDASTNTIAGMVNTATAAARNRIAALATAQSYGGSQFGLGTVIPQAFQTGSQQIGLVNQQRQNDLTAYGNEANVEPIHYAQGAGSGDLGQIANAAAKVAGTGLGTAAAGYSSKV